MRRPSRDEVLMESAMLWAKRGTCDRARVGVVISREARILATGYNGAPARMNHCIHEMWTAGIGPRPQWLLDYTRSRDNDDVLDHWDHGQMLHWDGSTLTVTWDKRGPGCVNVVHAEANAIAFAAKHGVGTLGAELHTTRIPCTNCAGIIINAGITRVVWYEEHRDMMGLVRLGQAGLDVVRYSYE